jgi:hypothetical protein
VILAPRLLAPETEIDVALVTAAFKSRLPVIDNAPKASVAPTVSAVYHQK